ncbi:LicD family protein [Alkalibacter sp. M17DMB]|nr:LicD family protein [Alkalibacter mobilis]
MDHDMKQVQDKILEVAVYLDEFCRKNDITYYLMGGSALGAIRHKGFIPWDDDFDVFMDYKNYWKFIKIAKEKLDKERFYLQVENTEEWPLFFTKLRMNHTTFIEDDTRERNMHKGFYVDIMCLNNTTENIVYRFFQYFAARLLVARTLGIKGYHTQDILRQTALLLSRVFIRGFVFKGLLKFVRRLNKKETGWVAHFFGRAKFKNTSFPVSYLGTPRYVDFEGKLFPVPEKVEKYLIMRYGDKYMEIPDEKTKALYPVHAVFVDPKTDYRKYEVLENGKVRSLVKSE